MNKICYGCGSKLQSIDKYKAGFIPEKKKDNAVYCQRCFRLIHYGENKETSTPKSISSIVNAINKDDKYVLFLVDFITLNKEIVKVFKKIKRPKTLVVSKCDIIPKSVNYQNIIKCLRDTYKIDDDISLISSYTNYGVQALLNYLYYEINKMMDLTDSKLNRITTSFTLNTTLDFIRLKLNDNLTIIDSPGFVLDKKVNINVTNKNNIDKIIKPKVYQMKAGETLKLEDIYFNFTNDTNITLYMNNDLQVKKYFKSVDFDENIDVSDNVDVIIKGLGFINIKSKSKIKFKNISKDLIEIRDSLFRK